MKNGNKKESEFSYDGLERLFHEKARLGIMTSLLTHPGGCDFIELKRLCGLTDGNLSRHLKMLAEEKMITIEKDFVDNKPRTHCVMTETGRDKFLRYIEELERVVEKAARFREGSTSHEAGELSFE